MVHLLAVNMQFDTYLNMISPTNISKDFDIEKESKSNSKTTEKDFVDSEVDDFLESLTQNNKKFLMNLNLENYNKHNFQFSVNALPIVHFDIQSPPPRA